MLEQGNRRRPMGLHVLAGDAWPGPLGVSAFQQVSISAGQHFSQSASCFSLESCTRDSEGERLIRFTSGDAGAFEVRLEHY